MFVAPLFSLSGGGARGVWLPAWLPGVAYKFEIYALNCAPSRTRTCGLLLRRQVSTVAGHGWTCPGVASTSHVRGWTWPGMAWCLWSLAPRLAPQLR